MRILVVEDEPRIADDVRPTARTPGFAAIPRPTTSSFSILAY
jgi:DNA-binding response OmpR family regulator